MGNDKVPPMNSGPTDGSDSAGNGDPTKVIPATGTPKTDAPGGTTPKESVGEETTEPANTPKANWSTTPSWVKVTIVAGTTAIVLLGATAAAALVAASGDTVIVDNRGILDQESDAASPLSTTTANEANIPESTSRPPTTEEYIPPTTEAPYIPEPLPGQTPGEQGVIFCDMQAKVVDVFDFEKNGIPDYTTSKKPGDICPEGSSYWEIRAVTPDAPVPPGGIYGEDRGL